MNKILFGIYRVVVPKPLRTAILRKRMRRQILDYYASMPDCELDIQKRRVLHWLSKNRLEIFPYSFGRKYRPENVEVFTDEEKKMKYVMLEGKRLYFKKRWGKKRISRGFSDLQREQDPESPHRYLTEEFTVGDDDVIADIGAAEGNFSLSVAEKVKKIYIFEYDKEWSEALKATFEPFGDKVEIINKRVADFDDEKHIRFDTFAASREPVNFLKIDVDGAERAVLKSCEPLFEQKTPMRVALCTYHMADDERVFSRLLRRHGFDVKPSDGYMIHFYDKKIEAPWLRRGLIRGTRP
jgi:hypothetical protein